MHECPVSEQTARIEIVSTRACPPEQQGVLATELAGLLSFTLSATFDERDVSFRLLSADGIAAHARALSPNSSEGAVDVLVVGTNDASDMETRISEDALAEAVKGESASWEAAYGAGVRVAWVRRDADAPDKSEGTVVCSAEERGAATALHYPAHLQAFFAEKSASCAEDARGFMNTVLADTLDGMAFQEWRPEQRGAVAEVLVPVAVPEWAAATLLQLSRDGDLWLSFLTTAPHPLLLITSERPKECADITQGESPSTGPTGATAASIKLFFELERQQELIRRKIASLERLMQCKQFVSHMESFTARLQSHAEELFSGIRIKQETPNTLDALCSQLSSLSMQCEACIDQAMDAVQKVGEAPQGEEFILQQQLTKIVHARSAKRHVDALKNQVEGALAEKRQGSTKALASSPPSGGFAGPSSPAAGARSPAVPRLGSSGQLSIEEGERSAAYSADRRAVLEMLDNIEKGLQVHKEQQEQLVDFWLKQHAIVKSELDSLKKMATDALTAEDIGVEELHGRFQKYCEFLEEHEHVEDKMLFPLVKSLFPQSAQALDSVLDPERHKGVDMLNAKVGRLLQQLHDRHRAGEEMVLNTQEMGKASPARRPRPSACPSAWAPAPCALGAVRVAARREAEAGGGGAQVVEALERLNDYMVGHIRYEEEMTMPWFEGFEQTPALRPLAIS